MQCSRWGDRIIGDPHPEQKRAELFARSQDPLYSNFITMPRSTRLILISAWLALVAVSSTLGGCSATMPFHGFPSQAALDEKDTYILKESSGGALDPMNLALEDQQYEHSKIAYSRVEEGYYQWGYRMYKMGYRDIYYVKDLAPHAFRHELMDTYDHALTAGFDDAQKQDAAH